MHGEIQQLLDRLEIQQLLHRRARAGDRGDREAALRCYHPDATEDHAGFRGSAIDYLAQSPVANPSHPTKAMWHGLVSTDVEVSGDEALAETYFLCLMVVEIDGELRDVSLAGRYVDTCVRYEGRWVIKHRRLIIDWSRVDDRTVPYWEARNFDQSKLHFGRPYTDDLYYQELAAFQSRTNTS